MQNILSCSIHKVPSHLKVEFIHNSCQGGLLKLLIALWRLWLTIPLLTPLFPGTDVTSHQLLTRQEAHKRIVWACSWNPFGHEFCTGSRDKTVKIWAIENESSVKLLMTLPPFKSSVTALSWVGLDRQRNSGLLAVGMENGHIELWSISVQRNEDGVASAPNVTRIIQFDPLICHVSSVNRLAWRNSEKREDCGSIELASCGADHCVRVFSINVL